MKDLSEIAQRQIKASFLPEYQSEKTEQDGLGIAIAHHFQWNGIRIMETFASALEDANFHTECAEVEKWINSLSKGE